MADDRVPLKEVVIKGTEAPPIKPTDDNRAVTFLDDLEYHKVADYFDVDGEARKEQTLATKLSYLVDWATEQAGSEDRIEMLEQLNQLRRGIGIRETGKTLVKALYQYVRLDSDRKRLEKEMGLIKEKYNIYGGRQK